MTTPENRYAVFGDYPESLREQVHHDLTVRALGGSFMYLAAWLIVGYWYQLDANSPWFFYGAALVFGALTAARLLHQVMCRRAPHISLNHKGWLLVSTILGSAVTWGFVTAWITADPDCEALRPVMFMATAGFGVGGGLNLCIAREVRYFYPALIFAPPVVSGLAAGGDNYLLVFMASCCLSYVFQASRAACRDYKTANNNYRQALERAGTLERLTTTDALTGLRNRLSFDQRLTEEWKAHQRHGMPLSLLFLDLDHFKSINDSYGHPFGDECLREVAAVLRAGMTRESDVVARYGGEEFVVILPMTDRQGAYTTAERLRMAIAALELRVIDKSVRMTCSIGGATVVKTDAYALDTFVQRADDALYIAKSRGRNRYEASVHNSEQQAPTPAAPLTPQPGEAG